jgi:DNA-binding SARP family transcriptional activator
VLDDLLHPGAGGASVAAVTVCRACEELIGRVEDAWPGGDADDALRRLRARIDGVLERPGAPAGGDADPAVPVMEVRCLGVTRIEAGGVPVDPPRRSRLVLQYLVAHGPRPVSRDVLLEAFWPGSSPAAARNSLNVAVTLLRRALRPAYGDRPVVVFGEEAYRIHPGIEVLVDRDRAARLVRDAAAARRDGDHPEAVRLLRAATALHRGPLFAEEPYEEWIVTMRRGAEAERLAALTDLGDSLAAIGDVDGSVEVLRAVLDAEPVREDVHRALMERFVRQGRPYLALRQFEECAEHLRRRLGAEPGGETWALRERIAGRAVTAASTARRRAVIAA